MKNFFTSKIIIILFFILCSFFLLVSVRGISGNPTSKELTSSTWEENGPFELSPERGRFALAYSMVENHSLYFNNDIGKFSIPDVGVSHGKYVSLFAPLLSFITVPGYIIGKYFGLSQVGSFIAISIFALFNLILIRLIAIKLGAKPSAATAASLIFLFGTPAFSYGVNLYQHHVSTFLILLSLWALLKTNKSVSLLLVFFLCSLALPLDYPNLFFMFPIGIVALGKIISFQKVKNKISIKISTLRILTLFVMLIPIVFFLWYNKSAYGNAFQLSGTLPTAKNLLETNSDNKTNTELQAISSKGRDVNTVRFFQTRDILNGAYLNFVSPDRGMLYFTPVMFFGFLGMILAFKKKVKMTALLVAIVGANFLLYEMWGDPWGGWAFGSRYLIPSYALLSIFIALLLTFWRKKIILLLLFLPIAIYSIAVNTLGAITTSAMPPQAEVLSLEKISGIVQRYTYQRNWEFLLSGNSKSFVYQTYLRPYITTFQFYEILVVAIGAVATLILIYHFYISRKESSE